VLLSGTRNIICGSFLGQQTIFGWVLTGPVSILSSTNRVAAFITQIRETSEESSDTLLSKFWEVKNIPIKMVKESDSYCESNFRLTTSRDACGKYMVTLPFSDPVRCGSNIGYSRFIALTQFLRNEIRLNRDSVVHLFSHYAYCSNRQMT